MHYKPDWHAAKKRLEAFWQGEIIDRCCAAVLAPRKTSKLPMFPHLTNGPWLGGLEKFAREDEEAIRQWWCDPEQNHRRAITWMENTYFGGEAVPGTYINWGASAGCAFWGSPPVFNQTSAWYHKVIGDWETWEWRFDRKTNPWWRNILEIQRCFVDRCGGRYFVGMPEIGNAADNLSLMRGMDDLCMDLVLNPDEVRNAVDVMSGAWVTLHEELHAMTASVNGDGGVLPWLNLWAPGRHDQIANDFSTAISSAMYQEFFFSELRKMGGWLDFATFHLDGPMCIHNHVDALLQLEEIDCIQFTPGAGSPPSSTPEYIPIFQKIQRAGKRLYLLAEPGEVEFLLSQLSARGLMINTWANSEEEANDLLGKMGKWSRACDNNE
ncbi:MAG: hypothetical protein WC003_13040 [Terrimicrobiaceae bacterium]